MSRYNYTAAATERRDDATRDWPRTARGKVICPECGVRGWRAGAWIDKHLNGHPHQCSCGKVYANRQGLGTHLRHNPGHRREVPERSSVGSL